MPIEFVDPPAISRVRETVWGPLLAPLIDQPGEWVRVARYLRRNQAAQAVRNMRSGAIRMPPGIWKVKGTVTFNGNASDLYVMYVRESPDGTPKVLPGHPGRPRNDGLAPVSPTRLRYGA